MNQIQFIIIDDDDVDRMNYSRIITKHFDQPNHIIEYANGADAINDLKNQSANIILLDYNLPDTNGISLMKVLRSIVNKDIPIIMLTGQGSENIAVKALAEGATGFIVKGEINNIKFIHAIKTALNIN